MIVMRPDFITFTFVARKRSWQLWRICSVSALLMQDMTVFACPSLCFHKQTSYDSTHKDASLLKLRLSASLSLHFQHAQKTQKKNASPGLMNSTAYAKFKCPRGKGKYTEFHIRTACQHVFCSCPDSPVYTTKENTVLHCKTKACLIFVSLTKLCSHRVCFIGKQKSMNDRTTPPLLPETALETVVPQRYMNWQEKLPKIINRIYQDQLAIIPQLHHKNRRGIKICTQDWHRSHTILAHCSLPPRLPQKITE